MCICFLREEVRGDGPIFIFDDFDVQKINRGEGVVISELDGWMASIQVCQEGF